MLDMERSAVAKLSERQRDFYVEHSVLLHNVPWDQYVALAETREKAHPRFFYLDGVLEIMSPSALHEIVKKLGARLVEAYAEERDIALDGYGSTTFREKLEQAGLEPDECYTVGRGLKTDRKGAAVEPPDLAIEVVVTNDGVDKLEIYRRLGVREVWFWIEGRFHIYRLHGGAYRSIRASVALRGIDLDQLARIISRTKRGRHMHAVRAYRRWLRSH